MPYKFKVLSIDGGGIRGIIPAIILKEIEKRTQKRISGMFDLIAGTSTGGILALGLTKPHPYNNGQPHYEAVDLIELYREEGKHIFNESLLRKSFTVDELLLGAKFPSNGREAVLQK